MKASLKNFIQTGSFGRIELGISRSTVEQHLGLPDLWSILDGEDCQNASIDIYTYYLIA